MPLDPSPLVLAAAMELLLTGTLQADTPEDLDLIFALGPEILKAAASMRLEGNA